MNSGIILAAGESKRIGSAKALLRVGNETFANRISRIMKQAGIQNIILVAGIHQDEIAKASDLFSVVLNPEPSQGQFSSLQRGVRDLPAGTQHVLVWPVDLPLVQFSTIRNLLEAAQREKNPVTIPVYSARQGHPVIYNFEALARISEMKPVQTAKELLQFFEGRVSRVEVTDPAVLIDIDTPEQYEAHITHGDLSPEI